MNYQLYFRSFGGTIWGNGVGGGSVLTQAISTNNNCPASTVINIGSPISAAFHRSNQLVPARMVIA
jgi:hypothetical protein